MKVYLFLWQRSARGFLRSLVQKPGRLMFVLFYAALIFVALISSVFSKNEDSTLQLVQGELTAAVFNLVYLALALFLGTFILYAGTNKGSGFFTPSDVQFLFTAPLSPQANLFYGVLNNLKVLLFMLLYLPFQFPNLIRLGLTLGQLVFLMLFFIFMLFAFQLASLLLYLLAQRRPQLRPLFRLGLLLIPAFFLLLLATSVLFSPVRLEALVRFSDQLWVRLFPLFGWSLSVAQGIAFGFDFISLVGLLLLVGLPLFSLFLIYRLPADFYEDAVIQAEKSATARKKKQQAIAAPNISRRLLGQHGKEGIGHGAGGSTLFFRFLREWRRRQPYFFGLASFVYLFTFGFVSYFVGLEADIQGYAAIFLIGLSMMSLLIRGFEGNLTSELMRSPLYTWPLSVLERLFWLVLADLLQSAVSLLPALLLGMVFVGVGFLDVLVVLLSALTLPVLTVAASLLTFRLLGRIEGQLDAMVLLLFSSLLALPQILVLVAAAVSRSLGGPYFTILLLLPLLNVLYFGLVWPLGKSLLEGGSPR